MRTRAAVVAAILAVAVAALPATATASPAPTTAPAAVPTGVATAVRPVIATAGEVITGPALEVFTRLNAKRAELGLPALKLDASLTQVAQNWSNGQAAAHDMSHNPYVSAQIPAGWRSWGENVGWTSSADSAAASRLHNAWVGSPGHFANMTNASFTHVGIGWAVTASGVYATQVFATYPSTVALPRFADVPMGATFYNDIEWAVREGVATGFVGGVFQPSSAVTREAMAAFIYRASTGRAIPACSGSDRMFSDVPAGHAFCGAIEWMAAQGITTGFPDGTFRPGQAVSREAVAAFLYRTQNAGPDPVCTGAARRFSDVPAAEPLCGVVEWLAGTGITTGWPDGSFRPAWSVERQAMAAFLHRAFG